MDFSYYNLSLLMDQADMLPQRHVLAPQVITTVEASNIPVKSGQQQSSLSSPPQTAAETALD
jgi:hypothetical protein